MTSAASEGIKEPVLVLIYGPSGSGKTTDSGLSFPNALFIAAPGALQSVRNVGGFKPVEEHARTLKDIVALMKTVGEHKKKGASTRIDALVVDDFSFIVQQTFSELEKRHSGFKLWGELRDEVIAFRDAARYAQMHVILNAWEQGPKDRNGVRVKGGPMLSGNLPEQVPAMFDMVLRCGLDPMRKPWPGIYQCVPDPSYIMKDRLDIAPRVHPAPMNIGELLRAAGYVISRLPELSWQEALVEKIATEMLAKDATQDKELANTFYRQLTEKGVLAAHAAWTIRDGWDRAVIRRALNASKAQFLL